MRLILLILLLFCFGQTVIAQDSLWTLERCIVYADSHNISLRESEVTARVARMQYKQSRLSQLPSLSLSGSYGKNFGRSIDPTSNQFENTTYDFTGLNGSASILLFGWFGKKNTIKKNDLLHQAAMADLDQLKDNVWLNIVNSYLQILLAKEQIRISRRQIEYSIQKKEQTAQLLKAGRSNGLDMSQMQTQLTIDSTTWLKAKLAYGQAVIDLKAILNLKLQTPFSIAPLSEEDSSAAILLRLSPETVYNAALVNQGNIVSSKLKVESAEKDVAIAKSSLYPSLSLGGSFGTNYSSTFYQYLPNGDQVLMPWGKQLHNNFSQSLYLSLNIPLFNGLANHYSVKQAKASLQRSQLEELQVQSDLRQSVYKAWNDAATALQTWHAAISTTKSAQKGYYFAQERYKKGLINAADFLTAQNTFFQTQYNEAIAKYDFIFKVKVIEFYMGR